LHEDTRDLSERSQAIAEMEDYIQRYRSVDRAGRQRERAIEISLTNREAIIDAQGLSSTAANRERGPAQIKANARTASRFHEERQRTAGATSQIKEPRRPRNLQPSRVAAQILCRSPRVLPDIFPIGFKAKLTHQRRVKVVVQRLIAPLHRVGNIVHRGMP
jgi:hypothetical protein